jgi:hypothetical protein
MERRRVVGDGSGGGMVVDVAVVVLEVGSDGV